MPTKIQEKMYFFESPIGFAEQKGWIVKFRQKFKIQEDTRIEDKWTKHTLILAQWLGSCCGNAAKVAFSRP